MHLLIAEYKHMADIVKVASINSIKSTETVQGKDEFRQNLIEPLCMFFFCTWFSINTCILSFDAN